MEAILSKKSLKAKAESKNSITLKMYFMLLQKMVCYTATILNSEIT